MKNRFNPAKRWFKHMAIILIATIMVNQLYGCGTAQDGSSSGTGHGQKQDMSVHVQEETARRASTEADAMAGLTGQTGQTVLLLEETLGTGQTAQAQALAGELEQCITETGVAAEKWLDAQKEHGETLTDAARDLLAQRQEAFEKQLQKDRSQTGETLAALKQALGQDDRTEAKKQAEILETLLTDQTQPQTYGESLPQTMPEPDIGQMDAADITKQTPPSTAENEAPGTPGGEEPAVQTGLEEDAETLAMQGETEGSEALGELAEELGTPLAVYNYLKNNIGYEYYYGSRKGAAATLDALAGNDTDQASLLIAMLRHLGYPAMYVQGEILLEKDQVLNLTGADSMENAALILALGGTPVTTVTEDGEITGILMGHTWVRAYLPCTNYRGAGAAAGKSVWLDLDTGIKEYETTKNIYDIIDREDPWGQMDSLAATADSGVMEELLETLQKTVEQENNGDMHARRRTIKQKEETYLPLSLQYQTIQETESRADIPDSERDGISFRIGQEELGTYPSHALAGKEILLSYRPATETDREILESYPAIFDVPAYAVEMVPALFIDGEEMAHGRNALTLGEGGTFTMEIHSAGSTTTVENNVTTGSMYAVTLDSQSITAAELQETYNEAAALKQSVSDNNVYSEEYLGGYLALAGKLYFAQVDIADAIAAESMGIHATRILSEGITGYEVRTTKLFGNTAGISAGSLYIDVDADIHAAKSLTGDREAEKRWFAATGMVSSLYESTIWEELTGEESVSTMTVLNTAREQGTEILVINDKNLDSETTRLDTDSATREAVTNAVHRGNTVIIPARDVVMGDWHGTGYIVMDMETGAGAYMISGGLNGGAFPAAVTLEMLLGLICSAFSEAVLLASIVTMCGILSSATGLALAGWTAMYILSVASLVAIGMSTYYMVQQWQIYLVTGDEDAAEYVFRMGAMLGLGALVDALLIKITSKPKNPGGGEEPGGGNNGGEDPGSGGGTGGDGPGSGGGTGGDGPGSGGGTGGDDPGTGGASGAGGSVGGGGKYTEEEIRKIIENLKGDGFKNNPLRQSYENEVRALKEYGEELLSSGMSEEQVARTLNQARRDLGIKYKDMTPQPLRDYIYEINMGRYGDKLGPTYDWLVSEKGATNMEIINSSSRPNSSIDKLLSGFEEWLRRQ